MTCRFYIIIQCSQCFNIHCSSSAQLQPPALADSLRLMSSCIAISAISRGTVVSCRIMPSPGAGLRTQTELDRSSSAIQPLQSQPHTSTTRIDRYLQYYSPISALLLRILSIVWVVIIPGLDRGHAQLWPARIVTALLALSLSHCLILSCLI